jgi:hypothetical protein
MSIRAALVSAGTALPCAEVARRLDLEPVVVFESATPTAAEKIVLMAHGSKFRAVVVDRLTTLEQKPLDALRVACRLSSLGIEVRSAAPGEGWLPTALTAIAPALAWIDAETKRARIAAIQAAVLRSSRRPGRPKKQIDTARALAAHYRLPLEQAAREIGCGASILRRWLRTHAEEQRLAAITAPATEAA